MAESRRTGRLRRLKRIYADAHEWSADAGAVPRLLDAINPHSKLVVVGEAVGPKTLRVSGVNYFTPSGRLGGSGRYLDRILSCVGYTIYPSRAVTVPQGVISLPSGERRRT